MVSYSPTTSFPIRTDDVQFGLLSPDEIKRMSVAQVKDPTIYNRGLPNPFGVNDHRMGTVDRRLLCGTCCKDVRLCQGHVGHIELPFPMYHVGFFDTTFKVLRCVCFACSLLLLTKEERTSLSKEVEGRGVGDEEEGGSDPKGVGKGRFQLIYSIVKARKRCLSCGMVQPHYTKGALSIRADFDQKGGGEKEKKGDVFTSEEEREYCCRPFTQRDALSILSHISDEDCLYLGLDPSLCHPKHMLILNVLVPPPVSRPAIQASEGAKSIGQDDLTIKLQDILKRSIDLSNLMKGTNYVEVDATPLEMVDKIGRLQYDVFTYMNNNIRGQKQSTQRSGAPTKSIVDRIKGKEGRIRGSLMGKRVDFSARSVITPDPLMDIDEVGVPHKIAMSLTVPERVNAKNIDSLTERVIHGVNHIRGAETVITSQGVTISLSCCEARDKIRLQYGWIVERYLQDDDVVIFNRQPSLHKMGMMGHRVRLIERTLTFRLNLCCANPYNADFDGDEMNLHVPQSSTATADVATLMMVGQQVISPQANRPVMGIVQDCLLGAYLMTRSPVLLDRQSACSLVARLKFSPRSLPLPFLVRGKRGGPAWTASQLVSLLFPSTFDFGSERGVEKALSSPKSSSPLLIRGGKIVCGFLSKPTIGTSAGGVIDTLYRRYGPSVTIRFMSDLQRLVNAWLQTVGFSVGIQDCVLSKEGEETVRERVERATVSAEELLDEETIHGSEEGEVIEANVKRILSKTLMQVGSIVDEHLREENAIRTMVRAGSKGTSINLAQICGVVGQQSVEGQRIFAYKGNRTLPCFRKGRTSVCSHGFVQNSYALGLLPHEYFYHAMGGREGLVDTAVKTATTGYIQRRQVKAMEDHRVCYDGTVRDAQERVLSFLYGGDGMDASRLERIQVPCLREGWIGGETLRREEEEAIREAADSILICKRTQSVSGGGSVDLRVLSPFNPIHFPLSSYRSDRCETKEKERTRKGKGEKEKGEAQGEKVGRKRERRENGKDEEREKKEEGEGEEGRVGVEREIDSFLERNPSKVVRAAFLSHFHSSRLIEEGVDEEGARRIVRDVEEAIEAARVHGGEMVGSIAAQSIGEPCTQLTLNSFHTAGISSKNVTLGIPRLKEILDHTKHIKTPSNCIRFLPPFDSDKEVVSYFASTLPLTRLGDVVLSCEFLFDPYPSSSLVEADRLLVETDWRIRSSSRPPSSSSRFSIRLLLNQSLMKTRRLTPPVVRSLLRKRLEGRAHVVSSETNAVDWVLRIRLLHVGEMMAPLSSSSSSSSQSRKGSGRGKGCGKGREEEEKGKEREGMLCHRVANVLMNTIVLCGHPDIQAAQVREMEQGVSTSPFLSNKDGRERYVVDTTGVSLADLSIAPLVDFYSTTSNDIHEVHRVLGIEAASSSIYNEFWSTITFDGTYVDPRHIMMVVDTMTHGGYIMPLSRHGINRMDTGPLLRCSFEETPDILCDAACFGEHDNGLGVSQNIMTGKLPSIGSGLPTVLCHTDNMHPRAVASLSDGKGRRIMKSSVRRSSLSPPLSSSEEYLHFYQPQPHAPEPSVEQPYLSSSSFPSSTSFSSSSKGETIFASSLLQKPFLEEGVDEETGMDEECVDFKPSSPTSP